MSQQPCNTWCASFLVYVLVIGGFATASVAGELMVPITGAKRFVGDCAAVETVQSWQFKTDANFALDKGASVVEQDKTAVTLKCVEGSVGVLWIAKPEDQRRYSKLQWEWKVDLFPKDANKDKSREDRDQAAQLLVIYGFRDGAYPARSFVWVREKPSRKWPLSLTAYRGTIPCNTRVKVGVDVIREGSVGEWHTETVDLAGIPEGSEPDAKVVAILLFADSNHTRSESKASFKNIVLSD